MGVFKKLGEGIADFSELNVQTFCSDLTSVIDITKETVSFLARITLKDSDVKTFNQYDMDSK